MTDLVEIGNARDKVLSLKLDQVMPRFLCAAVDALESVKVCH